MQAAKRGCVFLERGGDEMRVKDRAGAVANCVQLNAIFELRFLTELLQLSRGIARSAPPRTFGAHFHAGPDLHSADAARECLERKIRRRGKIDGACAVTRSRE